MGDMPRRKLIRLIEENGLVYTYSRSGHDYYEDGSSKVGVPQHKKDIEDPLLAQILREAGINRPR